VMIGDSKIAGLASGHTSARSASELQASYGPVVVYAGNGDRTVEVLASIAGIIAARAHQAILCVGRNDLSSSLATATWKANYQSITSQLIAAGVKVLHLLPITETVVADQSILSNWLLATYPCSTIDPNTGWSNTYHLAADNVHPNAAGHLLVAKNIIASAKAVAAGVRNVQLSTGNFLRAG
jgi:phospholipase/lecithinase/hemolysin